MRAFQTMITALACAAAACVHPATATADDVRNLCAGRPDGECDPDPLANCGLIEGVREYVERNSI